MERIDSLDTLKGIALMFVVYIHSKPFFSTGAAEVLSFFLANTSRIAVPIFFLTSGFLLSKKVSGKDGSKFLKRQEKKIGKYYILATLAYLPLILIITYVNSVLELDIITQWIGLNIFGLSGLINILYIGKAVAPFLWFLPALLFSLGLVYIFNSFNRLKELVFGSFLLHILAILSNTYLILESLKIPQEDTLFFGLFFTSAGFLIGKEKLKSWKSKRTYLWLATFFWFAHLIERVFISLTVQPWDAYYWDAYFWGPYSLLTAPMTIFLFLYMLNRPDLGKNSRLNKYGKHTLHGYIFHPIVIGFYIGVSLLINKTVGLEVLGTMAWDFLFFPLAYITTMESIIWLKNQ